jgi:nucleotidyltransferase substrate binding protein (TIGR01987 family)
MMDSGIERVDNDIRWKQRFANFENAYIVFRRALERHEAEPCDEIIQMGLVQAFEFTYELAWNTIKNYLENEGFGEFQGSKQVIRAAFQAKLIDDAEQWMEAVKKRNLTSHTYNSLVLDEGIDFITKTFSPLVIKLYEDLKKLCTG